MEFDWRALLPTAVFHIPEVLDCRALAPTAVLLVPELVLFLPELSPINVLLVVPELRTSKVTMPELFFTLKAELTWLVISLMVAALIVPVQLVVGVKASLLVLLVVTTYL